MVNYKKYNPVRCFTLKGKLVVAVLRFLYHARRVLGFKQWQVPPASHHEDPASMSFSEKLYLGYKYYFKAMVAAESGSNLATHFSNQQLKPQIAEGFVPAETITFSAGGDLIPYDCIRKETCQHLWDEAGDYFFNNDLVFANLETVASPAHPYAAAPEVMLADMFFNVHEETFNIFSGNGKYKGYDVLSTANNHSADCGREGIINTWHFLNHRKIASCGTCLSASERDQFPIIEKKGIKVAFLAYTFSLNKEELPAGEEWLCNHLLLNKNQADISLIVHHAKLARARGADVIVASLHMGCAYQAYPQLYTVNNMHHICQQAGVDILIGGHPHNAQPFEVFETICSDTGKKQQHYIIYSLGDFIAYDIYKWCHLPITVKFEISRGTRAGEPAVAITGFEIKPWYLMKDANGKLKLIDFLKAEQNAYGTITSKTAKKEVEELSDFFRRFIVTAAQQNVLAKTT